MFKLIKRSQIRVGIKEAEEFQSINNFEGQRTIDEKHLRELIEKMNDGRFLDGDIAVATLLYKQNEKVLMNGQHITLAILNSKKQIIATLKEYECPTAEDASLLFRQFDSHRSRSLNNCVKVEANALGIKWPGKIVTLILGAGLEKDMKYYLTKEKKIECLKEYIKEGNFINKLLTKQGRIMTKEAKHLLRIATITAMMLTYEKSASDSEDFWIPVIFGENLKKEDPRYKIRNYLMQTSIGRGRGASHITDIATTKEMISKCIHAWNAFRNGASTELRYYHRAPIPKAI